MVFNLYFVYEQSGVNKNWPVQFYGKVRMKSKPTRTTSMDKAKIFRGAG